MKHVVFLGGAHYPDFSAVGFCAFQVQNILAQRMCVTSISYRTGAQHSSSETVQGIEIRRISTPHMQRLNRLREGTGGMARAMLFANRLIGAARRLFSPETIDRALVKAYLAELESMSRPPDAIIPLVFPFESVIAALEYRETNRPVQIIPYVFDDFVDSGSLHVFGLARKIKRRAHIELERTMLEKSAAVLAMHPLEPHFRRNFGQELVKKVAFLEHPLLCRPSATLTHSRQTDLQMCFTGSLVNNVREPGILIDLLRKVRIPWAVKAHFYVMGNAAAKVPTTRFANGVEVINHGRVSKAEADAAVQRADFLLNLGEAQGRQVSSKIFEYMATGKPIIHLAFARNDAVTNILEKYPLALCLQAESMGEKGGASELDQFISKNRHSRMSFDDVLAIFPEAAPEATADMIENIVSDLSTMAENSPSTQSH